MSPEAGSFTLEAAEEATKDDADPKPKRRAPAAKSKRRTTAPKPLEVVKDGIVRTGEGVAATIAFLSGDEVCAGAVQNGTPFLADALVRLAEQSPSVRRFLEALSAPGAWGEVILASWGIAYPIMAHHGIGPFAPRPVVERERIIVEEAGTVDDRFSAVDSNGQVG